MIHEPNIPGSYGILLFTASDLASITSPIHNWVLFLLWLHIFILSGVISPLISSSILGTSRPGQFIFQCPIFFPFHSVYGRMNVLKAGILKWFAILFSSGPHFVRTLHYHLSWVALQGMVLSFVELHMPFHQDNAVIHESGRLKRLVTITSLSIFTTVLMKVPLLPPSWVAISFSRGSSQPGIEPRSPTLQVDSLPFEPLGKLQKGDLRLNEFFQYFISIIIINGI